MSWLAFSLACLGIAVVTVAVAARNGWDRFVGDDDLDAHFGSARELTVCRHESVSPAEELRVDGEVLTLPEVCMDCMAVRGASGWETA